MFKDSRSELLEVLVMSELFSVDIVKNCEFIPNPNEPEHEFMHEEFIRYLLDQVTTHIDFLQSWNLARTLFHILESILEAIEKEGEVITKLVYSLVSYIVHILCAHKLAYEKDLTWILQKAKSDIMDRCVLMSVENKEIFVNLSDEQMRIVNDCLQLILQSQEKLDNNLMAFIKATCERSYDVGGEDLDTKAITTKLLVRLVEIARSVPVSSRSECLNQCLEQCGDIEKSNAVTIGNEQSLLLMVKRVNMKNLEKVQNFMKSMKVDQNIFDLAKGKIDNVLKSFAKSKEEDPLEQLEAGSGDDVDY
ncbi:hypothetical protein Ciccas_007870 [Cichlidogyrus casuarinus]|uniref:Uncharacterized protein n=1 Tax=Cichlidogyrus casuarinus TaxID=1844966 RepID=A0ABD2Q5P6_9PLAT